MLTPTEEQIQSKLIEVWRLRSKLFKLSETARERVYKKIARGERELHRLQRKALREDKKYLQEEQELSGA